MTTPQSKIPTINVSVPGDNQTLVNLLQSQYGHLESGELRAELETLYPQNVWSESELREHFVPENFEPPYLYVTRRDTGARGLLLFVDSPRMYFDFRPTAATAGPSRPAPPEA
ncbi:hypothetical protein EBZ39_05490 [bacterium]|nr:hypothetical protein [bacterium]